MTAYCIEWREVGRGLSMRDADRTRPITVTQVVSEFFMLWSRLSVGRTVASCMGTKIRVNCPP